MRPNSFEIQEIKISGSFSNSSLEFWLSPRRRERPLHARFVDPLLLAGSFTICNRQWTMETSVFWCKPLSSDVVETTLNNNMETLMLIKAGRFVESAEIISRTIFSSGECGFSGSL